MATSGRRYSISICQVDAAGFLGQLLDSYHFQLLLDGDLDDPSARGRVLTTSTVRSRPPTGEVGGPRLSVFDSTHSAVRNRVRLQRRDRRRRRLPDDNDCADDIDCAGGLSACSAGNRLAVTRVASPVLGIGPDDGLWNATAATNYAMVWRDDINDNCPPDMNCSGQQPTLSVKAIHDGSGIAFRMEWNDTSASTEVFEPRTSATAP